MPVRLVEQISAQEKRETQIAQGKQLITTWYIIIHKTAIPLWPYSSDHGAPTHSKWEDFHPWEMCLLKMTIGNTY